MKNNFRLLPLLLLCIGVMSWSCNKDKDTPDPTQDPDYQRRIKFVLQDNFNFSISTFGLQSCYLLDTLATPGPYTYCATVDPAWNNWGSGQVGPNTFQFFTTERLQGVMRYAILKGVTAFNKLPLDVDTALLTMSGAHVYVKKYLENGDTMTTVNGVPVLSPDNFATNGNVQAINGMMYPEQYATTLEIIRDEPKLTLFAVAMEHAGLDSVYLTANTPYTILAPVNDAFMASAGQFPDMDLTSITGILATDPAKLAALLKCHLIKGRCFQRDLYRLSDANNGMTMVNGEVVVTSGSPQVYNNISFRAPGNTSPVPLFYQRDPYDPTVWEGDNPAINGVVYKLNAFLIP